MYNFIWRHKAHYIKKADIIKPYEQGSLMFCLFVEDSFWFTVPSTLFQEFGGIQYFLNVILIYPNSR